MVVSFLVSCDTNFIIIKQSVTKINGVILKMLKARLTQGYRCNRLKTAKRVKWLRLQTVSGKCFFDVTTWHPLSEYPSELQKREKKKKKSYLITQEILKKSGTKRNKPSKGWIYFLLLPSSEPKRFCWLMISIQIVDISQNTP